MIVVVVVVVVVVAAVVIIVAAHVLKLLGLDSGCWKIDVWSVVKGSDDKVSYDLFVC